MSSLKIEIANDQQVFVPGAVLSGTVRWTDQPAGRDASLRLLWYTQGKGTEDLGVVKEKEFENTGGPGRHTFEFTLPVGPYSFSGSLISLIWALELQVGKEWIRREFVLSPTGREILLERVEK